MVVIVVAAAPALASARSVLHDWRSRRNAHVHRRMNSTTAATNTTQLKHQSGTGAWDHAETSDFPRETQSSRRCDASGSLTHPGRRQFTRYMLVLERDNHGQFDRVLKVMDSKSWALPAGVRIP